MLKLEFPKHFYWGAATSSHQVEGDNTNDWSAWEKQNAERLARESEETFRSNPHWIKFKNEATDPKNYISGKACEHYTRYEADFDLLRSLYLNAYRFSIEWSRIEPREGEFEEKEIAHYRAMIAALRARGIEPFVTLWHWTLPVWLAEKGGIEHRQFPQYFERYARTLLQAFGAEVQFWITLNEPDVIASHAYLKGAWPPQKKNLFAFFRVLLHLIRAHRSVYRTIKQVRPEAQVGIAKHQIAFEVARPTLLNLGLKKIGHYVWNRWLLDRLRHYQDFIGLNHYNRNVIDHGFDKNPNAVQTDFGWEYWPESIYEAALALKRYEKPIYITENGLADASDHLRQQFIPIALAAVHRAIQEGADIRGYLYWSFLDNFEWDKGFWLRFGLIQVDYATQARTLQPSARAYAAICRANALIVS